MFVCLFVLSFNILSIAQENPNLPQVEFFFGPTDPLLYKSFVSNAFSIVYDYSSSNPFPITQNYNNSEYSYIPPTKYGWHFVDSQDLPGYPVLGYGLYKLSINNAYFYLDLRDQRCGEYPLYGTTYGHTMDVWFEYDQAQNKFFYTSSENSIPYTSIINGSYLTIWDIKRMDNPEVSKFQQYWLNCLASLFQYDTNERITPLIVWGPKPNFNTMGYLIYRAEGIIGQSPGSYTHIATITDPNQFIFSDIGINESQWSYGNRYAAYKVTAFDDYQESEPTNVSIITPHFELSATNTSGYSDTYSAVFLNWEPFQYLPINGYKIYRSIVGIGQAAGSFSLIHTITTPDSTEFLDNPEDPPTLPHTLSGSGENIAYYKIVPYSANGETYSSFVTQVSLSRFDATVSSVYNDDMMLVPFVSWDHIDAFSPVSGYKIYRSIKPSGQQPGTYSNIATIPYSQNSYTDNSLLINGNQVAYYKVRAYRQEVFSDYSNRVSISVSGFYKKDSIITLDDKFENLQIMNFPNPFNSSTQITFSIPEPHHVNITVVNTLGQRVTELMNGFCEKGIHTVQFNAQDYPSGLYFLYYRSGAMHGVHKMIYIR
ncbi:MAG: T9SS type A sorting domain-containing protein [Bacteroidota bacterium]